MGMSRDNSTVPGALGQRYVYIYYLVYLVLLQDVIMDSPVIALGGIG